MRRMDRYSDEIYVRTKRSEKNQELYQNVSNNSRYTHITDVTNANAFDISNHNNEYTSRESYQKMRKYQNIEQVPKVKKELEEVSTDTDARLREQSLLEFEIQEIEDAHLKEGEDEQLEQDYRKMTGAKRILEALTQVRMLCMGEEISASEQTSRACRELAGVQGFDV